MMVETILESSQDFGMSNGSLPQWKRELLQRRAARSRTAVPPAAPPPPPPPPPPLPPGDVNDVDDEELRYGPGIVKRLKSRYLSLALRDAPRRRPSVLRRAASLEHLLDERVPSCPVPRPAPALRRPPRPASVAAPPLAPAPRALTSRRDSVKRARSVDALSRLERDDPPPPSPSPPPPPPPAQPRPAHTRAARPPRRPTPLLRETERPPVDLVRSALRKFEVTPTRRPQPAARVSVVLRDLEPPPRTSTPEPARDLSPVRSPSPAAINPALPDEPAVEAQASGARLVSRAALEEIARAGSTTRYAFDVPRAGSHLPPLAATNPVLVGRARRVGVIRPMPAPPLRVERESPTPCPTRSDAPSKIEDTVSRVSTPPTTEPEPVSSRTERRDAPPSAAIEPMPRNVLTPSALTRTAGPIVNGRTSPDPKPVSCLRKIGTAGIERAWSGSGSAGEPAAPDSSPWGTQRKSRAPPPAATIMVFNFSDRKEVPDYIENDGIVLRASRKNTFKAGDAGVVVLRPEALLKDPESEDEADCGPPSPCALRVRFLNDNVLINGRSSMTTNPNKDRIAKLKLQFDDSLTRTFEYPSENSLCEDSPCEERASSPAASAHTTAPAPAPTPAGQLAANTHIASAALSRYTPSKTVAAPFQLGVTRHEPPAEPDPAHPHTHSTNGDAESACEQIAAEGEVGEGGDVRPCGADAARSWSEARTHATDLLF